MKAEKGVKLTSNTLWRIAIIAAACLVYFTGISHESIWYDEAYSHIITEYPLAQILNNISYDNHPPLYYLLLCNMRNMYC